ncbi:hypothetical protein SARC_09587 [Sphaeroforma arctica JP610]|uniref:Uncharacterized protein n=1 Tax=Sphaeroforma arctica JP610 TaxID=667725 RepID=A0A0L0FMI1_9EUKA|nr:hypothetical protein SARC_09587 [Sphaeroforma arctica JP610]KNC77965.1 hypothetical protein SARC_09587 [Sphaeroforma arctica JP610]|eukprot:XP_014151867.1 hypothetical protein SARC_09587 [Sphaeroforma arctica JP610]
MDTISIPRGIIVLLVRSVWVALTTVTLTVSYYLASIAEADSITARHAQSALTRDVSPNTTPSKEMGFDSDTSDACNERREEVNAETPRSQLYLFLQDLSSWGKTREPASSGTVQQHKHRRKHKGETPDTTKTLSHYATHEQDVQVKHNEEGSQNSLNGPISQLKQQAKTISLGEQAWWWEGLFEVDKRFFTHFYIFGTLMSLGSLVSVLYLYKADDTLIASTGPILHEVSTTRQCPKTRDQIRRMNLPATSLATSHMLT